MNRNDIKRIERAAARAIPAPETVEVDGWTISLGRGEVGRINSAVTNGYRPRALLAHIEAVERRFGVRHRAPRFRLTPLDQTVDGLLDERGYERSADVLVMTMALGEEQAHPPAGVTLRTAVTPRFVDRFRAWGGYSDVRVDEIIESLSGLTLPYVAATSEHALAVGVVDGSLLGLFDVVVDPEARGNGHGRDISSAVLGWGLSRGAGMAYLQVHSENAAAVRLYRSLGFEEAYRYWYRSRASIPH
jgi:ribosomal protein S18 acetylase RimI-like enzyme